MKNKFGSSEETIISLFGFCYMLLGLMMSIVLISFVCLEMYEAELSNQSVQIIEYNIQNEESTADLTEPAEREKEILDEAYSVKLEEEYWSDSLEYLACCVEAEAGNQSELGRRLVCDAVLNRYDKGEYDDLYDVINEPGQFSVVSDGRINKVVPSEQTYRIIQEELKSRTNRQVLHFREGKYHNFGTPLFIEGDHYFSM